MDFTMELDCVVIERSAGITPVHHSKTPTKLRRTQSYDAVDAANVMNMDREEGHFHAFEETSCQSPLHTSFDILQLGAYRHKEDSSSCSNEMLPPPTISSKGAGFTNNYLDAMSAVPTPLSSSSTSKTPLRMRFSKPGSSVKGNKASGKKTPASAKRHRTFAHRLSPAGAHRTSSLFRSTSDTPMLNPQIPASIPLPTQPRPPPIWALTPQEDRQVQSENYLMEPPGPLLLEPAATPALKKPPKRSIGTATTVANSTILETTSETDVSSETNDFISSQTFHFSSFPASLPRITTMAPQKGPVPRALNDEDGNSNASTSCNSSSLPPPREQCLPENHFSSLDDFDDMSTSPIGTPVGRRRLNFNSVISPSGMLPGTPKEVRMHFHGQCSPIRGIPEEDGDITSTNSDKNSPNLNQSLNSCSSGDSRAGRSRPMPDIGAFEGDISHDGGSSSSSRSHPASPRLLCPPTPVRTPAWVHAPADCTLNPLASSNKKFPLHKYGRQNSLIQTKVLAICSQHDLEGRKSLENSLLEDDLNKQQHQSYETSGNASILTGAASESETEHVSTIRVSHDNSDPKIDEDDNDDGWLHNHKPNNRLFEEEQEVDVLNPENEVVSMSTSFEVLGILGRGTFADVFKVRSRKDGKLYAVKKHRRQFRGRRDRDLTLAEVRYMQRLQSTSNQSTKSSYCLYLLFFYQAWQEDGHFFCQTELCCRDTCREFMDALRMNWVVSRTRYPCLRRLPAPLGIAAGSDQDIIGRLVPEPSIWKICHDISAGLSHIHSHGLVHHDIKPSNIFMVSHPHFGVMCKIGDFGMAGYIGTSEDGAEGDQKYMAPELLSFDAKHPSADMFSLGLTLYELASSLNFEVPSDGQLWHDLRSKRNNMTEIPSSRDQELTNTIRLLLSPDQNCRPSADFVLHNAKVQRAGAHKEEFLMAYIKDVEEDERRGQDVEVKKDDQTPRVLGRPRICVSPSLLVPYQPSGMFSSPKQAHPSHA